MASRLAIILGGKNRKEIELYFYYGKSWIGAHAPKEQSLLFDLFKAFD